MKIAEIRVDGFGILSDLKLAELPSGLSVIHGPNEAGKSTLLDFLRGALFGFPDRRHNRPFHEPLRGGRHGGMLRIVDDGVDWTLRRHTDGNRLEITTATGESVDEDALSRLLGHADDKVFRSVFAFGLGELASFSTLDNDEVRDLIFSAGVLGAGRSAMRASRAIEQRRAAIVRPRQQDAQANQLRARLVDIETALREAKSAAEGFEIKAAECEQLALSTQAIREHNEVLRRRRSEIDFLKMNWPVWRRREEARRGLDTVKPLSDQEHVLVELDTSIHELHGELSGITQCIQQRSDQTTQLESITQRLRDLKEHIGMIGDLKTVAALHVGLEVRDHIRQIHERHLELQAELRGAQGEALRTKEALEHSETQLTVESSQQPARDETTLRSLVSAANELKRFMEERDDHTRERANAELRSLVSTSSTTSEHRPERTIASIACSVLFIVASIALAYRRDIAEAVGAGILACVAIGFSLFKAMRSTPQVSRPSENEQTNETLLARVEEGIARRGEILGLGLQPTRTEIDSLMATLEDERDRRRILDGLAQQVEVNRVAAHGRSERQQALQIEIEELEGRANVEAQALGFKAGLRPAALLEAIEQLSEAADYARGRERVLARLTELDTAISSFEGRLHLCCVKTGVAHGDLTVSAELTTATESLMAFLKDCTSRTQARREFETVIREATETIAGAIGEGDVAERLERELVAGAILEWDSEREQISRTIDESNAAYDAALSRQSEGERQLEDLTKSEEISRLDLERRSVEFDLENALSDWATLGLAQSLLSRTLARYEQDRQPVVIARAAELFATVTDGRYVNLISHEDEDGRHRGIAALSEAGERIDSAALSRGTAEQLYLCLRLAFAITFAERSVSLPLVLDDVLVNFDPERATAVAEMIASTAKNHQVLAFTCHPHVVEYFRAADAAVHVVELPRRS